MQKQANASLFGPAHSSFDGAQAWVKQLKDGSIKSFVPIHGKVAGYHVEPSEKAVPVQKFEPPIQPETEVQVTALIESGNISITSDKDDETALLFYPHIVADVEYQPAS